ncbi:hypothetical protein [Seleniivibrio woodruffii]|uniref:hypothetical protein n=1 Tax=Seleniivibrio woodruffii TaxID=1078050 RepID=UPI00240A82ED|nr:hypothetical protein [Seleniivibrio woodruffii]
MIHNLTQTFLILLIVTFLNPIAHAFEVGSKIKAVCKSTGRVYEGKVVNVADAKNILLINKEGAHFRMPVEQIRSVTSVKGEQYTAANGTKMNVVKIVTKDGQTVYGGVNVSAVIAFESVSGESANLMIPDMHRFRSIEIEDSSAVSKL